MKLKVVSDLHLEFSDIEIVNNGADVLILSGDIFLAGPLADFPADYDNRTIVSSRQIQALRFRNFLRYCSEDFKHVIYIAGNHEFYHHKWVDTINTLREECEQHYSNVHFLENNSVTIDDVVFVGGTLWTDCNKTDPLTLFSLKDKMNDFNIIRNDQAGYRKLMPADTVVRHRQTLEYIDVVASNANRDQKVVVVGHHAPSFESVADEYKDDREMNGGYASDLSAFILDHPNIALWTHGHMHNISDYHIGATRVVCNPRGYVTDKAVEMTFWDPNLIIEV